MAILIFDLAWAQELSPLQQKMMKLRAENALRDMSSSVVRLEGVIDSALDGLPSTVEDQHLVRERLSSKQNSYLESQFGKDNPDYNIYNDYKTSQDRYGKFKADLPSGRTLTSDQINALADLEDHLAKLESKIQDIDGGTVWLDAFRRVESKQNLVTSTRAAAQELTSIIGRNSQRGSMGLDDWTRAQTLFDQLSSAPINQDNLRSVTTGLAKNLEGIRQNNPDIKAKYPEAPSCLQRALGL